MYSLTRGHVLINEGFGADLVLGGTGSNECVSPCVVYHVVKRLTSAKDDFYKDKTSMWCSVQRSKHWNDHAY